MTPDAGERLERVLRVMPLIIGRDSVPVDETVGTPESMSGFVVKVTETENATCCALSFAGPELIAVAQSGTVCAPAVATTTCSMTAG